FDIIQHHCYSDPRFLLQGLYCGNHSSQLRRFGLITASGFTGLDLVSFNENSLIGMAEKISDDRLRREAKELLDGKAKTLLDNNQLTMRIMRKLLEEKLGLAEGSLEAKKKAICAFVKEALALEPDTTAAAATTKAPSTKGAATAAAAVPGGSTGSHKENQKPRGASNSSDRDGKAAKGGGKARQADPDGPSDGAAPSVGRAKGRGKDVEKVQRRSGKKRTTLSDSATGSSDSDSSRERDEEEADKRQKKRAKKAPRGSSGATC
ncbi:hypothetical protein Vafri_6014, partial [Volvox africanus]